MRGTSLSEVNYALPNTLAHYELSSPGLLFDTPLGTSFSNIAALLAGHVDFAVSLAPLSTAQAAAHPNVTALPVAATTLLPVYRLDALDPAVTLAFHGSTLALIYAGNITNWNDTRISDDNPGVALPDQPITVVFLNSSRHFNYILLTAFNKFEPSVAGVLPVSNLPAWPVHRYARYISVTGVTGTSAEVVDADGALSIDSANYATYLQATVGYMYNAAGTLVNSDDDGQSLFFTMAELLTARPTTPTSFADLTDCQTANCWPLAAAAYALLDTYASPRGCAARVAVVDFFTWYYQQTVVVERMLVDYGLQSLGDELQEPLLLPATLASITCYGAPVAATVPADVFDIIGVNRLLPLINMVVDLHAVSDSSVDFEYVGTNSSDAMLQGRSTLELAVLYASELNQTSTPVDRDTFVLIPSFLTSVIVTFNKQLSPSVYLNASELVVDLRTLALIFLGNISDWGDERLVALNPIALPAVLDHNPAPIGIVHGCSNIDPGATRAPLFTFLFTSVLSTLMADPLILQQFASPAGLQALGVLETCSQSVDVGRFGVWTYVTIEDTISTLVSNRPGSIGYALDGNSAEGADVSGVGELAILMPTRVNGQPAASTVRRSTPNALRACAASGDFERATLELDVQSAAAWADDACWPLTQVVYMQIPRDYPADAFSMGVATAKLLQWVHATAGLDVWCDQNMFVRTASLPSLQPALLSALDSITSGGATVLTLPIVWQLTAGIADVAYAIEALGWLATLAIVLVTIRYRQHVQLRSTSPLFTIVSLAGVALLFGAIQSLIMLPSDSSCRAFSALIQLGFTVTFTPLFAKAYRIYRIFGRRKLRVVKLSNIRLFLAVVVTILADGLLIAIWHGVAPPSVATVVELSTAANGDVQASYYAQCTWDGASADFMAAECVIKVVSLCLGVMLAFSTRQVTDRFNDSKSISLAIYNLVFALVVILPIMVLINAVGDVRVLLLLFCITEIGFVTLGVLFLPKLLSFLSNNSVAPNHSTSVYRSSEGAYSFLSLEQLASLPQLGLYVTALTRHLEEARKVQSGKRTKPNSEGRAGSGTNKTRESRSEQDVLEAARQPDTGRSGRISAAGGSPVMSKSKGLWMKSSTSAMVSPTGLASPLRIPDARQQLSMPPDLASKNRDAHSRTESGGQDKEVESAVHEAVAAAAVTSPSRTVVGLLLTTTSPRAVYPQLTDGQPEQMLVSSVDPSPASSTVSDTSPEAMTPVGAVSV